MNIDGLGPATIQLLIASKVVKDLPDLYKLESSKLLSPEKTNLVSTNKLLNSIERSKHADLWRVICGIGIPGIGKARANILAETIGSLESLSEISKVDFDGASEYNSIEAVTRRAILDYFSVPDNRTLVKQLILAVFNLRSVRNHQNRSSRTNTSSSPENFQLSPVKKRPKSLGP
jgi:DNA ligase (NAD+)